jgi:hypothetical protein
MKNYNTLTRIGLREECDKLERLRDESTNEPDFGYYQELLDEIVQVARKKKIKL